LSFQLQIACKNILSNSSRQFRKVWD